MSMEIFKGAKWIWSDNNAVVDGWLIARKTFVVEQKVRRATINVAVRSGHFDLYINGNPVIYNGGLPRNYDFEEISHYLTKGSNTLALRCRHHGDTAGLIFAIPELGVVSDQETEIAEEISCQKANEDGKAILVYDQSKAFKNFFAKEFYNGAFGKASEYGEFAGDFIPRVLPKLQFGKLVGAKPKKGKDRWVIQLPALSRFFVNLEFTAVGGESVFVYTDRREVPTVSGEKFYNNQIRLICDSVSNNFSAPLPLLGQQLIVEFPPTVKLKKVGYRLISYNTAIEGKIGGEPLLSTLSHESADTLLAAMRTSIQSAADRKQDADIGDLSLAASQIGYMCSPSAAALILKSLDDVFANFDKHTMTAQKLIALGEYGILGEYVRHADAVDEERLARWAVKAIAYLDSFQIDELGLVVVPEDAFFDDQFNIDKPVLLNALYYSACRLIRSFVTNEEQIIALDGKISAISDNFSARFWCDKGYASIPDCYDDRANAWAVLSGLAPSGAYDAIATLLANVATASTRMESYVLLALGKCGRADKGYMRLKTRFFEMLNDKEGLWETFEGLGSRSHIRSGSAVVFAFRWLAGIEVAKSQVTITPDIRSKKNITFTVPIDDGSIVGSFVIKDNIVTIDVSNYQNRAVDLILKPDLFGVSDERVIKIAKGKNKMSIVI